MIGKQVLATLLATLWALSPVGRVEEVRISPVGDETEIAVITNGDVEIRDFVLRDPARLILDVHGAVTELPDETFEGIGRGGVIRLRSRQFREDVVRLVFDLSRPATYRLAEDDGRFTVRFPNPGAAFEPWSSGAVASGTVAMRDRAPVPTPDRSLALPGVSQDAEPARITVAYDSASMLEVLAGFSEFAGVSIVPSAEAAGRTVRGVDIRNQRWDVALDAILAAQGLGWRLQSQGILIVDALEGLRSRDTLQTETRVFRINYASADSVAATLAQLATPNRGQVVPYLGANSVIVTDAPSVVSRMDSLVRNLDVKTAQVAIDAKIIFVDRTDVLELGIIYDLKDSDEGVFANSINDVIAVPDPLNPGELTNETLVDLGGNSIAALANANDRVLSPSLEILASVAFGDFSLSAWLQALEQHQLSDVQAAPTIQVVDNHNARIQVGEKTPVRVLDTGSGNVQAQATVQYEDTGIILDVTPHITNNNQILLDVSAERSGIQTEIPDVGFTFLKQIGQTRLLLDDGETMVIGGLTLSEVSRSETGIPLLMDVPVIGPLFRTTKSEEQKTDLIILVTPHIVD